MDRNHAPNRDTVPYSDSRAVEPLHLLEELFGHRWEAHALLQLALAGPMRRADLATAVGTAAGGHIPDAQLDRSIRRLCQAGLARYDIAHRHKWYQLTPAGRRRADLLEPIAAAVQRLALTAPTVTDRPDRIERAPAAAGHRVLARRWAQRLKDTPGPLAPAERQQLLETLAGRLLDAMEAPTFDHDAGARVGAELVAAGLGDPTVLGQTIIAFTTGANQSGHPRLMLLIASLAEGFSRARLDAALDAQEALRRAAVRASHADPLHTPTIRYQRHAIGST